MSRITAPYDFMKEKNLKPFNRASLRRENIVAALTVFVIVAALPFAIRDTLVTGRVYLFSKQFLEELPRRFSGAGNFRFILQPVVAILLGVRGGLADAASGNPPYLIGLLFASGRRRELLLNGLAAIRNLFAIGIILDVVFQLVLYHEVHPGAALLVGPLFICIPYALSRALTNRLARRFRRKSNPPQQRRKQKAWLQRCSSLM